MIYKKIYIYKKNNNIMRTLFEKLNTYHYNSYDLI